MVAEVESRYTFVQSEMDLRLRVVRRMSAFDSPFDNPRSPVGPGGRIAKNDCRDIIGEEFSDVKSPVFFNNRVANQASCTNLQTFRRAIKRTSNYDGSTESGSRWYIPQAENSPGCSYEPVLYMEADSLYAPGGPIDVRKMTGDGLLIRDVRVTDTSPGSAMIDGIMGKANEKK